MTRREHVELGMIAASVGLVGVFSPWLPARLKFGQALTLACLTWLLQGGVRDAWILYQLKRRPSTAPKRRLACMCLESSAGLTGLMAGIGLSLFNLGGDLRFTTTRWVLLAGAVFALGFLLKDYVISWRPLGLRRDPDHLSIVFTWW